VVRIDVRSSNTASPKRTGVELVSGELFAFGDLSWFAFHGVPRYESTSAPPRTYADPPVRATGTRLVAPSRPTTRAEVICTVVA
jgi:hypothetical protein